MNKEVLKCGRRKTHGGVKTAEWASFEKLYKENGVEE